MTTPEPVRLVREGRETTLTLFCSRRPPPVADGFGVA